MRMAVFAVLAWLMAAGPASAFEAREVAARLRVDGRPISYETSFAAVMPGAEMTFEAAAAEKSLRLETQSGRVTKAAGRIAWRAPFEPGHYRLRLRADGGEPIRLQLFVMMPAWKREDGKLNGYEIGRYPLPPEDSPERYDRPDGFIEVTEEMRWLPISPHFVLGQFLCKQEAGWPKYLLLRPRLVTKLERLLAAVNARGFAADTLHVMSGYRTPTYNDRLENVPYSRHLYGDAADVYVDSDPIDFWMDDLTGEGRVNRHDAGYLFDIAARLGQRMDLPRSSGGLGEYGATEMHGPFLHIDARGEKARWGRQRARAQRGQ